MCYPVFWVIVCLMTCVVHDYNHLLDLAEYSKNDKSVKK